MFQQSSPGNVVLVGKADTQHQSAEFFVIDEASGRGVITQAAADGSFTSESFPAAVGDAIRISLQVPTGRSSYEYCTTVTLATPLVGAVCAVADQ